MNHFRSLLGALTLTLGLAAGAICASEAPASTTASASDPFLWLEDVEGERALEWVTQQNKRSLDHLTKDPRYQRYYDAALKLAEAKDRLPFAYPQGEWMYNFWQDDVNVRGLWRRAPLASYVQGAPKWETLLDVDELARREAKNWVFKAAKCLPPQYQRCMVRLSDGGKDASVYREFDTTARSFVQGGFEVPEAKAMIDWDDRDTLLIATDWGPGTLTASGYPYILKEWKRGQPLTQARELFRGEPDHIGAGGQFLRGKNAAGIRVFSNSPTYFTTELWTPGKQGALERITLPSRNSVVGLYADQLIFAIKEDWALNGRTWKSGSLLSMPLAEATSAKPAIRLILEPGARDAIHGASITATGLLVAISTNVRGRLLHATFENGSWRTAEVGLPKDGHIVIEGTDPELATAFVTYEGFLQPPTIYAVDNTSKPKQIMQLPAKFDSSKHVVEQFEATSRDGTRVPYFVVRPKKLSLDGSAPTLLTAYGGFQIARFPSYSATLGQLWLDEGGVYVLANIRGGGEFGPAWHQAGLKTKRQVVYDDFIAVSEDLIRRKITSPRHLGIRGGSNGGLLMGVMLTQRPELFRGVIVQVPLLDMLRYHKLLAGASWVDEYGSPDVPEERAWLEKLSPYQNLRKRDDFPVPFIVTSTKDDRVHPGHARKYGAKLESLQMPFYYYENIDGGHSAAANLREAAKRQALEFTYLRQQLMD
nr:prolyl oligopeptidase family serine peptidase [uncultured Steroidobacter sp.]